MADNDTAQTVVQESPKITDNGTVVDEAQHPNGEEKHINSVHQEHNAEAPVSQEDTHEDAKRTLNQALGKQFLAKGSQYQKPEVNPEELWKQEEALSLEERRKRYKCERYYKVDEIPHWQEHGIKANAEASEREKYSTYKVDESINKKIALFHGDITTLELDAIVNAANASLLGGAGVDGAIHDAAGDLLREECRALHGCQTGQTKITRGYSLPAKYVLHTVGPIGTDDAALESSYSTCLALVIKHNIKTVAFCGISTGIYGFPRTPASKIALATIRKWLETDDNKDKIDLIVICTFTQEEKEIYDRIMPEYFPLARPEPPKPEPVAEEPKAAVQESTNSEAKIEEVQPIPVKEEVKVNETSSPAPARKEGIVEEVEEEEKVQEIVSPGAERDAEKEEQNEKAKLEEEARKTMEEQVERKRKKDLELKKQRDDLEKRIKEEHDKKLKEEAIKKQKQTQERKSQGKRIKPNPSAKAITLTISKASMFTPETKISASPPPAGATPTTTAKKEKPAAVKKPKQLAKQGQKGVSKEEGISTWQLVAVPVLLASLVAFSYFRSK